MIRKFKFEDEMHESLQCVPMAVRRKLDRVGLKVGLEQWKALDRGERFAICHIPADSGEECDALAV
ncbi:MAG TPA: nitrate reductase associated protein, partial [Methylomirabilota bacterium]|nr:nitrate reductase associated protein [Methylomirabilota bacterium]